MYYSVSNGVNAPTKNLGGDNNGIQLGFFSGSSDRRSGARH